MKKKQMCCQDTPPSQPKSFIGFFTDLLRDSWQTSVVLLKITIPVIIVVKILTELGVVGILAKILDPLMGVMDLPGSMGLVWATGMLTNLYGALAVFANLATASDITVAQATTIGAILLFAHSLPVEMSITKKAGAGFSAILALRIGSAFIYGTLLAWSCRLLQVWQQPANIIFQPTESDTGLLSWIISQAEYLVLIMVIIFALLFMMRVLRIIGLLDLIERLLAPILPFFGMSRRAAPLTVIGMIVGLGYGGALILREAASGKLTRQDIFNSLALMGICHGLIEDTLLMVAIGGSLSGLLWLRILFSLIFIFILVQIQKFIRMKTNNGA